MSKDKQTPKHMTLRKYREALHEYDNAFLQCKDLRHAWATTSPYQRNSEGWVVRILTCGRCGTVRTDTYAELRNKRLARASSSYRYPAGFALRHLPQEENLSEVMRYESYLRAMREINGSSE
jgi:hypothetical protein